MPVQTIFHLPQLLQFVKTQLHQGGTKQIYYLLLLLSLNSSLEVQWLQSRGKPTCDHNEDMDLLLEKFMWRQQMAISALLTDASQELNKEKECNSPLTWN